MTETIRYAWGKSSLGDFYIAVTGQGLTALEFAEQREKVPESLASRFPADIIKLDEAGLVDIVAKVRVLVEHPGSEMDLKLDIRGTDYQKKVWDLLRQIPAGQTTNYGS